MSTPRILLVMPLGEQLGGGEMMFRQLLQHGRGQGAEFIAVFTKDGPMVAESRALGVETHLVEAGRIRELPRRIRAIRRIAALARERRADLVFGWMVASQLLAGPAAMLAGVPGAWYQVGLPRPDWLDRLASWCPARGIVVLSEDVRAAQARVTPRRPMPLVYPGASLERFEAVRGESPAALRASFGLPAQGPLIGIVGRLQRWKGMHTVIEAMPAVRAAHPGAHLAIIGGAHETEPGYGDVLRARTRTLGLEGAVTFAGFQADVPRWMQAMDILVHASDREPFGIVVVEAMALGKPVVAGDRGGPAEIITDGTHGLLSPFGDAPALARALGRFLGDPAFAAACGAAARARAQDFSAARYARELVTALRALAAGTAR
ncbi:MAG: glycosyltransferase family 4 protein [Gemmatimonadaceae bacterium]|nr:glycosyltransferase family 4 protein [Gemmatimonadaceae bacterium]